MNKKNRVVITGIGLLTPLGSDTKSSWQGFCHGKASFSYFDDPRFSNFPSRVVGYVPTEQSYLDSIISPAKQRKIDRFIELALLGAHEAFFSSGIDLSSPLAKERCGVYIGVGIGGLQTIADGARAFDLSGIRGVSPLMLTRVICSEAPGWVSMEFDMQGPISAFSNACASGADAIGHAYHAISSGFADYMVAGGAESCICDLSLSSFGNMRVLSTWQGDKNEASRPFSADRSGFVMSEGACLLMLERLDYATARNAPIIAEIVGYGASSDAYHSAAIHPQGRGAIAAMKAALFDAAISPCDIDYINAHGTATTMNDAVETYALKQVFKEHINPATSSHTLVSSTKSMSGHMLGATGAVEIGICALALQDQIVPPTINLAVADPACDLDYVPAIARRVPLTYAMSNSFGFGGCNAVVVLKKI